MTWLCVGDGMVNLWKGKDYTAALSAKQAEKCPGAGGDMRCYLNLVDATQTLVDHEGVEVSDLDEAREAAREAVAELVEGGADLRGWRLEAVDASGTVLFAIRLDAPLS